MKFDRAQISALVLLCGCAAGGFEMHYSATPGAEAVMSSPYIEHSTAEPAIYAYANDLESDNLRAQEEGYLPIGSASFEGAPTPMVRAQLAAQARKVGASMVLLHSHFRDTITGVLPYAVANAPPGFAVAAGGAGNIYGSRNYAAGDYASQGTIVAPGGTTTFAISSSVGVDHVFASFWAHQDPAKIRLGIMYAPLPTATGRRLHRDRGLLAVAIIRGSPAFNARIQRGDIIVRIAGEEVIDAQGFDQQQTRFEGQSVNLEVLRGDDPKIVTVTLNRRSQP